MEYWEGNSFVFWQQGRAALARRPRVRMGEMMFINRRAKGTDHVAELDDGRPEELFWRLVYFLAILIV